MHLEALADALGRCTCKCTLKMHIEDAWKMHLQMHLEALADAH
jgi:hypothetical protein